MIPSHSLGVIGCYQTGKNSKLFIAAKVARSAPYLALGVHRSTLPGGSEPLVEAIALILWLRKFFQLLLQRTKVLLQGLPNPV
jgi:hypothetical protein